MPLKMPLIRDKTKGCQYCEYGLDPCACGAPGPIGFDATLEDAKMANLLVAAKLAPDNDPVNLPAHYARYAIEPIRFITENKLPFIPGNVIKYVMRWDAKDGIQDLYKAKRYMEMLIKFVEGNPDWWKKGGTRVP